VLTSFCLAFARYLVLLDPEYKLLKFEGTQLLFVHIQTLDVWIHQPTSTQGQYHDAPLQTRRHPLKDCSWDPCLQVPMKLLHPLAVAVHRGFLACFGCTCQGCSFGTGLRAQQFAGVTLSVWRSCIGGLGFVFGFGLRFGTCRLGGGRVVARWPSSRGGSGLDPP
jgi:hypothetical protein